MNCFITSDLCAILLYYYYFTSFYETLQNQPIYQTYFSRGINDDLCIESKSYIAVTYGSYFNN